jgi:hypothetical protein
MNNFLLYKVLNANVSKYPFPHIVFDQFVEPNNYRQLLDNLPDDSLLDTLENARGTKGYKNRFVINLKKDRPIESLKEKNFSVLNQLTQELLNERFANALMAKFPEAAQRAGEYAKQGMRIGVEAYYVEDRTGYVLPPHTDSWHKLVTGLLYLPTAEAPIEAGTSIFVPKEYAPSITSDAHLERHLFDEVFRVPFSPNKAVFFARNEKSFHGVEGPFDCNRNLIIFDIFVDPN